MPDLFLTLLSRPSDQRLILASLPVPLLKEIDHLAVETDQSRSEIIRKCLIYSLDRLEIVDPE